MQNELQIRCRFCCSAPCLPVILVILHLTTRNKEKNTEIMELNDRNNIAVCALQQGRPDIAFELLSTTLASLKDHFAKRQQGVLQESTTPITLLPTPTHRLPRCVSDSSIGRESDRCDDEYDDEYMQEDEEPELPSVVSVPSGVISSHNNGLVLNFSKALMVLRNLNDLEALASVVLYNMALVNHGRAIERGSSTPLASALKFYKMATSVIKSKKVIDSASDFVLLLCCHNMAHIYSSQFCPTEMRDCFGTSHFLLAQKSTQQFLDEEDMSFFSMSTLLETADIRLAPAA